MTLIEKIKVAQGILAPWVVESHLHDDKRLDIVLDKTHLLDVVQGLKQWGYLATIVGLDEGDNLAVLYIFCSGATTLSLKIHLERVSPCVPSLCGLLPSAVLHERELQEMFGIVVENIPDSSRLFLPDDWSADVFPLRKDAQLK